MQYLRTLWVCLGFLVVLNSQLSVAQGLDFDDIQSDEPSFLPVDQAFVFSQNLEAWQLRLEWKIAPDYYLYQDRIHVKTDAGQVIALSFDRAAELKDDPNFGQVKIFHDHLSANADLGAIKPKSIEISYQGCSQAGLCYPVQKVRMEIDVSGKGQILTGAAATASSQSIAATEQPLESADGIASFLRTAGFWGIIGTFLVLGIGLSLTPCVLPMVPILSGIIAGQGEQLSARRGFLLASAYVFGMSFSYAVAGVCVGYFGASANISAWLQNPWVLSVFAGIFVVLALAMFGFYELQLPSSIMNKLNGFNQKQQGGRLFGVAIMGALSALVVSPCVSAPLAGALIYISTTGDAMLGGAALFALGLGMGVPLLLIGLGGGALVPKAGMWMLAVKSFFGVLLLAVALWMLSRFVPGTLMLVLWALLFMGSGIALGAFEKAAAGFGTLWRTLGIVCVFWASLMLIGAATGAANLFKPLEKFSAVSSANVDGKTISKSEISFTKVTTNAQLQSVLDKARAESKPVMVDYYADWCTACLDMARTTFADARLHAVNALMVQVDITDNTRESTELLKRFGLFAPPSLVFFNQNGEHQKQLTVMGEIAVEPLLRRLETLQKLSVSR
ncbi:MAG TPA: protein-disulfide reductase DsbD [Cellvibrio sp.]|nr:protein-disulfide reductase DsbD [Cellvibrio sp.]